MKQADLKNRFNECGATVVEVALLIALVFVISVASVQSYGSGLKDRYAGVADTLSVKQKRSGGGTFSGLNANGGGTTQGDMQRPNEDPHPRTRFTNIDDFRRAKQSIEAPGGGFL